MIKIIKQNQMVNENRNSITYEYFLDGIKNYDGFVELLNVLQNQQYTLSDFSVHYDYDHSNVREDELFNNYEEFLNAIRKEFFNVVSVEMRCQKEETIGLVKVSPVSQIMTMFMPQKKELKR